jgi:hypothetical protein
VDPSDVAEVILAADLGEVVEQFSFEGSRQSGLDDAQGKRRPPAAPGLISLVPRHMYSNIETTSAGSSSAPVFSWVSQMRSKGFAPFSHRSLQAAQVTHCFAMFVGRPSTSAVISAIALSRS